MIRRDGREKRKEEVGGEEGDRRRGGDEEEDGDEGKDRRTLVVGNGIRRGMKSLLGGREGGR